MGAGAAAAQFCRLADGPQQIAYASMGEGSPLVMLPGWPCHLEESWAHPAAYEALTSTSIPTATWWPRGRTRGR